VRIQEEAASRRYLGGGGGSSGRRGGSGRRHTATSGKGSVFAKNEPPNSSGENLSPKMFTGGLQWGMIHPTLGGGGQPPAKTRQTKDRTLQKFWEAAAVELGKKRMGKGTGAALGGIKKDRGTTQS